MNKTEIMETTIILDVEIKHVGRKISSIFYNGLNLRDYFFSELNNLKISCNFQRPDHSSIQISDEFKDTITHIFDVINELYKTNACLAAYLSSFIFECFTPAWNNLIREGRHILAIQLWRLIIEIVHDYEHMTGNHIHKGSPYAFLADTYLIIGEIDNGFTYLYNAIEDDIKLNSVCPELNYPQNAPVYLTASISSNPQNIMAPLVHEIRTELGKYLEYFRNEFKRTLTLTEFDSLFLQNAKFEIIKYYFVFIFWTIYDQNIKVDNELLNNDFSKLKNTNWLFALCLIIDKLFSNHPVYVNGLFKLYQKWSFKNVPLFIE